MSYSVWRGYDHANARFVQHHVRQNVRMWGTPVHVHRYMGPVEREASGSEFPTWDSWDEKDDATLPDHSRKGGSTEVDIQDLFFLENRDRKYDRDVYEVRGHYRTETPAFELERIGILPSGDTPILTFAHSELVEVLGRPLMPGDVLELPHRRQAQIDPDMPPIDRYYVVEDAYRPGEGYDVHWLPHLWQVRCSPVRDQQEFYDVLAKQWHDADGLPEDVTLLEVVSTAEGQLALTDALREEASRIWPFWYVQHGHLYVFEEWLERTGTPDNFRPVYRLVCAYGDGEPPNGAKPVGKGTQFPTTANDGEYFLRTDYVPPVLFRRESGKWAAIEVDHRRVWTPVTDSLTKMINERGSVVHEGTGKEIDKRQYVTKALLPRRRRLKGVEPDL